MSIGERILAARTDAGLSQRELAGETITRNMLSALEHDKAKPSLDTLYYLSEVLKRPVSYFLGEDTPVVEGYEALLEARSAYDSGKYKRCAEKLDQIPEGTILDREKCHLKTLALTALGEQALAEGKIPYARELGKQAAVAAEEDPMATGADRRRIGILRGNTLSRNTQLAPLVQELGQEDGLLLRAKLALGEKRFDDAVRYLDAVDDRDDQWNYLMGEALFALKEFERATVCFHRVEKKMGKQVRRRLQICYAELKDFEKAYHYATME